MQFTSNGSGQKNHDGFRSCNGNSGFSRDQITGSIWKYLFVDQPKQTGYTVFTLASAAFTMYAAGQLPPDVNTLVFLAFTTGFTCDSVVNSGSPVAPISQETLNGDTQK